MSFMDGLTAHQWTERLQFKMTDDRLDTTSSQTGSIFSLLFLLKALIIYLVRTIEKKISGNRTDTFNPLYQVVYWPVSFKCHTNYLMPSDN